MSHGLTILGNPGHGNGPTVALVLAAEAIQAEGQQPVSLILPYRGRNQVDIVERRKNPHYPVSIYYDHTLGALLHAITLRHNDFAQNVADIIAYQPAVQRLARQVVAGGLTPHDGRGKIRRFEAEELDFELNHGSRMDILDRAYIFFPCLLSDLLQRTPGIPEEERRQALSQIREMEARYAKIFIPKVHTFSWDPSWQPPSTLSFIPFPRPVLTNPPPIPQNGLLVMPSGVGRAGNMLLAEAALAVQADARESAGVHLQIYCPAGWRFPELPQAVEIPATALAHPNVELVIGRAGWGTIWECLNAATPFLAIRPLPGDDPEIAFNAMTLESTGLGTVWQGQDQIYERTIQTVGPITALLANFEHEFGTMDGLHVMARTILQVL